MDHRSPNCKCYIYPTTILLEEYHPILSNSKDCKRMDLHNLVLIYYVKRWILPPMYIIILINMVLLTNTIIDLYSNNLVEEIPASMGILSSLHLLNLS